MRIILIAAILACSVFAESSKPAVEAQKRTVNFGGFDRALLMQIKGYFGASGAILAPANGGTGINNGTATFTNATSTTITGGGTIALGGFTATIPATGTAALIGTANVFSTTQTMTHATMTTAALNIKPGIAPGNGINFFNNTYGIGQGSGDLVLWTPASQGVSITEEGSGDPDAGLAVARFSYDAGITLSRNTTFAANIAVTKTITAPGTTGAQTIDKTAGRVNFAGPAGPATLTVTNSLVTANSIVIAILMGNDATALYVKHVVPSAGSFVITLNAAPTLELPVNWIVIN